MARAATDVCQYVDPDGLETKLCGRAIAILGSFRSKAGFRKARGGFE